MFKDDELLMGHSLCEEFSIGKLWFVVYELGEKKIWKKLYTQLEEMQWTIVH